LPLPSGLQANSGGPVLEQAAQKGNPAPPPHLGGTREDHYSCLAMALLLTPALAGDYQPVDVSKLPLVKQTKLGLYLSAPDAYKMKSEGGAKVLFVDIRTKGEFQFLGTPTVVDQNIPYMEIDDLGGWDKKNNRYTMSLIEGDMSLAGRRDVNGWKNADLPWTYRPTFADPRNRARRGRVA
jgi:hypothetical protein